ncbi:multidrug ABC transporter ATP-binding protein [Dyadobacter frigoris]|uniref:ABC transporter ATP-binding protein n=1 Tax=Dyadobacter frigoris TaxID=2576211 RepID=UPI0024A4004F|nr:ABC transporter ATP-binding protein [Dyadobacter frigoris]GLU52963.1 multidrug ABC transporter ATP-binding protein [Dyadobacter frigoris]
MSENNKSQSTAAAPSGMPGSSSGRRFAVEKPKNMSLTVRRLWGYLQKNKLGLFTVVLFILINTLASLTGSYLLRPLINDYIIPKDVDGLIHMLGIMLVIYIAGATAAYLQSRFMIIISQKTVNEMRNDLFKKLQSLPLQFFDTNSHGDLMSRFTNDVDLISESLNNSLTQIFTSIITLTGTFLLMLYISPLLTLVTLVMVPLMLFLASQVIRRSKNYFIAQQKAVGITNGYIEEIITGIKVVKVFGYEEKAETDFEKLNFDLRDKATKAQMFSGMMMPIMINMSTINYALTATIGGILAVTRGLDIGGLASFLQYSRQFGRPINELSSQLNSLQAALAGAERVFEMMDQLPEPADAENAITLSKVEGQVRFENVTFSYSGDKVILHDINLSVKPGHKIAFVGSTGAGKTTIINLLPRFYDIQSGKITIDGTDIKDISRESLRKSLAIVLQDTHLFVGTVMENIRYGRLSATDQEVIHAAELANAHSFITRMPQGYNTVLDGDGSNLSQGQRQLLNIARATVAEAPILILDEATSSIDTRTERLIEQGMDTLMKGKTTFVIAHRLSTVRNADEIIVLEYGRIIERGNHNDLILKKGKYYQLYTGQFS